MAFTHPTSQKLLTTPSNTAITPPPAYVHDPTLSTNIHDFEDSSDEDDEPLSSIHLKITTPLLITGDNNFVAIDPSFSASKIAMAVVQALKQMSMAASGVPMIDEEGRPRPIRVEVVAEIKIEGSRNVVGERAVMAAVAAGGMGKRKVSDASSADSSGSSGSKRGRAESEPVESQGKRVRTE